MTNDTSNTHIRVTVEINQKKYEATFDGNHYTGVDTLAAMIATKVQRTIQFHFDDVTIDELDEADCS